MINEVKRTSDVMLNFRNASSFGLTLSVWQHLDCEQSLLFPPEIVKHGSTGSAERMAAWRAISSCLILHLARASALGTQSQEKLLAV